MNFKLPSNVPKHLRPSREDKKTSSQKTASLAPRRGIGSAESHDQASPAAARAKAPKQIVRSLLNFQDSVEHIEPALSPRKREKMPERTTPFVLHMQSALSKPPATIQRSGSNPNLFAGIGMRPSVANDHQVRRTASARRWSSDKAPLEPLVIETDGNRPGSTRYMRPYPPTDRPGEPRLPNRNFAVYKYDKFDNYLLNSAHKKGSNHGQPLADIGFERVPVWENRNPYPGRIWAAAHPDYQVGRNSLIEQVQSNLEDYRVEVGEIDRHGRRYAVDMHIDGPEEGSVTMQTKWIDKRTKEGINFFRNRPEFDSSWKFSTRKKKKNEQK